MEKPLASKEFCQIVIISYTTTGRIRVPYSEIERIVGKKTITNKAIIYAKVSSQDQKGI